MFRFANVLVLVFGLVEALGHNLKQKFKLVALHTNLSPKHRIDKLLHRDVPISKFVCMGHRLLQSNFLIWESITPDLFDDLLGTFK